ncbi:MAG: hypothetical protein JST82_09650 [Bacteroidetes bacterium]|nr:hypothetical protein [Bacteroidota bacterium]
MRHLFIFLSFIISINCVAQSNLPDMHSYSDKVYYVSELNSKLLRNTPDIKKVISDVFNSSIAAKESGDIELYYLLQILGYRRLLDDPAINVDSCKTQLERILNEVDAANLIYVKADVLQALGTYNWEKLKNHVYAVECYKSAYNIYKNFSGDEFPMKQFYIYTFAGMYYGFEDDENVIKYLKEALTVKPKKGDKYFFTIYNTIGLSYRRLKQYDSALYYFNIVLDSAKKHNDISWIYIAGGNIGSAYYYQGKYNEAKPLLQQDMITSLATNQIRNATAAMGLLGNIYFIEHKYDSSEQILKKAFQLSYSKSYWPIYYLAEQWYDQLSKVYAAKNNMNLAFLYADSALIAKDSMYVHRNALALSKGHELVMQTERKLEEEKLQNQIKLNELQKSKTRVEVTFFIIGLITLLIVIFFISKERKRSENLLLNILPEKIADRLKKREHPIADYFDNASVLFVDMAEFTLFADGREPNDVVSMLNSIFTKFDILAEKHGLEKIKTIGDCYMAVSGLPTPNPHHAEAAVAMAMDIKKEMKDLKAPDGTPIHFRMGLDCGPVVAGVIGRRKFIYDLWGDTVNTASRMETTGIAGEIHCSERFKQKLEGKHIFISRGLTEVKGKGMMETWLIME